MKQMTLYRKPGTYSFSPVNDGGEVSANVRLIPDEGKVLTNGTDTVSVLDVPNDEIGLWSEIAAPSEITDIERLIIELEGLA